jgi:gamma-glutamylputrescine oxidase
MRKMQPRERQGRAAPAADARSWYAATANSRPLRPSLKGEVSHDVVVVGAGFTGLSTALELAMRGYDVAILEGRRVGWGASGRNGGQVVTGFTRSLHEIRKHVGAADAERLWRMAEEGKRLVRERIERYGISCDYRPGYMYTAVKPSHERWLRNMLDSWQGYGYGAARWLGPEETRSLVDCPYYLGGIFDDENGHLHPLNYALGLAQAAEQLGVKTYENSPVTALRHGTRPRLITAEGAATARFVVLAGNALLGPISKDVESQVNSRIVPVATYVMATEPMPAERAEAIIPGDIAVSDIMFVVNYYRRTKDNRLLFGGGLDWSGFTFRDVETRLRNAMYKWLPRSRGLASAYCWGGLVDMTYTMLPNLARLAPNVFNVHGFSGNGITLTGIAGRITAEAIAGTAERFDVFSRLPAPVFPGGPLLRKPIAVAGALWYKLKDLLP